MAGCRQSLHRPESFSLRRFSAARARPRSCRFSGVSRTRFGFLDVFGFAVVVAGFEALRAGVRAAAVLLFFLNQSQGGMCICRKSGTGLGVSQEGFGP